jgi:hypothetical protein
VEQGQGKLAALAGYGIGDMPSQCCSAHLNSQYRPDKRSAGEVGSAVRQAADHWPDQLRRRAAERRSACEAPLQELKECLVAPLSHLPAISALRRMPFQCANAVQPEASMPMRKSQIRCEMAGKLSTCGPEVPKLSPEVYQAVY